VKRIVRVRGFYREFLTHILNVYRLRGNEEVYAEDGLGVPAPKLVPNLIWDFV